MRKLRAILLHKKGAAFFLMAFVSIVVFIMLMAGVEVLKIYTVSFEVETQLRRLVNNSIETNIDDKYRKDGINQLTSLNDAKITFTDNFHWYTMSNNTENSWVSVPAGCVVYGSTFSEEGDFLFMICVETLTGEKGGVTSDPSMKCTGTIYIANSIPGLMHTFVFDIPFSIETTNFRIPASSPAVNITG